jgi:tetratricopeptide (TPR) repeat protein
MLSLVSVVLSIIVFIVSVVFIIGGSAVGNMLSNATGISYLEVRPSFQATVDIGRDVYAENAFVGIGTNKFADAWRLYKDVSINETVFWSTDFTGGSGYLTTLFVNTGILGMVSWILFFCLFLAAGLRMLFKAVHVDRFWYFFGTSAFVGALYLWGMSFVYVPGAAILLLAAVFTSIVFVAHSTLLSTRTLGISISNNKRAGFALVGVVMLVIVASTSALFFVGRQYASVHTYGTGLYAAATGEDLQVVESRIASAYDISQSDVYALQLAMYQLSKINALLSVPELSAEQEQELQASIQNGINAAQIAVEQDQTEPANLTMLGSIYSVLASASVEGAAERAAEMFQRAQQYDPQNPLYALLLAQLSSRTGDLQAARTSAQEAVRLKNNYTDALFFLTQLDIAEGKTADAITTTRAIISLEPNNPARHYQLGVLLSANNEIDAAITAFEQAIALDTNYANARYFLALAYAQQGNTQGALQQLQAVLELNPGNAQVQNLIERLNTGESLSFEEDVQQTQQQVDEPTTVTSEDGTVTTTEDPDTPLISPVNTVGDTEEESVSEETR